MREGTSRAFPRLGSHTAEVELVLGIVPVETRSGVRNSKIMSILRIAKIVDITTRKSKTLIEDAPILTKSNIRC